MVQRLTALYLMAFLVLGALMAQTDVDRDYGHWMRFWSKPLVRLAVLLFGFSVIVHAWIGVRSVLRDYVRAPGARFLAELLLAAVLIAEGLWCVRVLWL